MGLVGNDIGRAGGFAGCMQLSCFQSLQASDSTEVDMLAHVCAVCELCSFRSRNMRANMGDSNLVVQPLLTCLMVISGVACCCAQLANALVFYAYAW